MKILMIEHFSSTNMYSMDLCDELGKIEDIELLTVNDSMIVGDKPYKYEKCLFGHYDGSKIVAGLLYIQSLIKSFTKIKFGEYDVIHVHTFRNIKIEMFLYRLFKNKKAKYIYTVHNVLPHEVTEKDKKMYESVYKFFDYLILHNEASLNAFKSMFNQFQDKTYIIPHGTFNYIKNMVSPKTKSSCTTIFMMGLIRKYKGVDILLEALTKLPEEYARRCKVIIAGRQDRRFDDTDYVTFIENHGLNEMVKFIPNKITDEEMAIYYNQSDVCVFPYRYIYGSGALLMAYTFRKPVIVSKIPAFLEETEYGETGYIFENENAASLAEKIMEFMDIDNNQYQQIVGKVDQLMNRKYNWLLCAKNTADLYRK